MSWESRSRRIPSWICWYPIRHMRMIRELTMYVKRWQKSWAIRAISIRICCRRMAQFELTLLDWAEEHKGSR